MNRRRTEPGLGSPESLFRPVSGDRAQSSEADVEQDVPVVEAPASVPAPTSASASAPAPVGEDVPPRSSVRFEPPAAPVEPWAPEAATGTRHRRQTILVDDVGDAAVKIATSSRPSSAPKLVATRTTIARAPIDTRAAFVLSLVDGQNSVDAIVDMSGMAADEVNAILARLVRLGLITLP